EASEAHESACHDVRCLEHERVDGDRQECSRHDEALPFAGNNPSVMPSTGMDIASLKSGTGHRYRVTASSQHDTTGELMTTFKVGYLIGSLATASINRLLAKALVRLAPEQLHMVEIPFRDLPLYSYDYDADFPPPA